MQNVSARFSFFLGLMQTLIITIFNLSSTQHFYLESASTLEGMTRHYLSKTNSNLLVAWDDAIQKCTTDGKCSSKWNENSYIIIW